MNRIFLSFVFILHIGFAVSCQSVETKVDTILKPCLKLLEESHLIEAGKCIENAIYKNPPLAKEVSDTAASAVFRKCVEIKAAKDFKNAIICFEGAKELMPESANVRFNLGNSYLNYRPNENAIDDSFLEAAEAAFKEGLRMRNDTAAEYKLATVLRYREKYQEAIKYYEKLVKDDPSFLEAWSSLGLTQQKIGDYKESIISLNKSLELSPDYFPSIYFLAVSYDRIGETQKATQTAKKALELRPDDKDTKLLLDKLTGNF